MNTHETKYQNTEKRLEQALLSLLERKDFAAISVADVCREAGVYRSTFYSHYGNTRDLLEACWNSLLASFFHHTQEAYKLDLPRYSWSEEVSYFLISPKVLRNYLDFLKKNRKILLIYRRNASLFGNAENQKTLQELVFRPSFETAGIKDPQQIEYLTEFYLSGVQSMIYKWVDEDCLLSEDKLITMIRLALLGPKKADEE